MGIYKEPKMTKIKRKIKFSSFETDRIREIMNFRSGEKNMSKPSKKTDRKTTDFSTVKRTTKSNQSEPALQRWRLRVK
jgi:hypothetical protein